MEDLFKKVGFGYEYRDRLEKFYRPYFPSAETLRDFSVQVFKCDNIDKTPRRIINQIERFVQIANDIEIIRPGNDSLRIVFLQTCIEAIYKLSEDNGGKYKIKYIIKFF